MKAGRLFDGVLRGVTKINWGMEILAETGACALAVVVIWGVVLTYVFVSSDVFSVELSEYLLVLICFASVPWVLKEDRHVRVEVLVERLSPRTRRLMDLITSSLAFIFCCLLSWKAAVVTFLNYERGFRSASLVSFPLWVPYVMIAIGAFLLTLQYIVRIRNLVGELKARPGAMQDEKLKREG